MPNDTFTPGINYDHPDGQPRDAGGTLMVPDPITGHFITSLQAYRNEQTRRYLQRGGPPRRSFRTSGRRSTDE